MIDLKGNTLLREIPDNLLVDKKVVRLAESLQTSLDQMLEWAEKVNYTTHLDLLDDEVIEHLLWENHIGYAEGLALAVTKEQRVNLVRNAVELHRIKGTPAAIELALDAVGLKGEVAEWFETNSAPYHFSVELFLDQKLNDLDLIREMILEYKNVRSWFDGFTVIALEQGFLYWDESYSYPVYFKVCNDFWGMAETINTEAGKTLLVDDSYSYPVYYDVNTIQVKNLIAGRPSYRNDSYGYPLYFQSCGDFETPDTKSAQFEGAVDTVFEAYSYPAYYSVCGEFEAGG